MKSQQLFVFFAIVLFAGTAKAGGFYSVAPDSDIEMCVTRIAEDADYVDAGYVRHEVVSSKRRTVGYELAIQTLVYDSIGGDVIREYQSECVATGGKSPGRFEIAEAD